MIAFANKSMLLDNNSCADRDNPNSTSEKRMLVKGICTLPTIAGNLPDQSGAIGQCPGQCSGNGTELNHHLRQYKAHS